MQQYKSLTLRRNFSWTFVGNAVYAACQWGMLMVLAKLGSPEMVGQFTLGLAITAPVFMFTNLDLRHVQATDAKSQYLFSDYLGLRIVSTLLALVVIVGITFKAGYNWETSLAIFLVGLAKAFESISDVFYGLFQQNERMDRIAFSLMIRGPLSLLLLGIGVYMSGRVVWGVVGLAMAWAVVLLGYDLRNGRLLLNHLRAMPQDERGRKGEQAFALRPQWQKRTLTKLVWLALPIGFTMALISLNSNIPRYFIEQNLGQRELGVFAAIAYLMVAGSMVVTALGQSATPRLAKYYADGNGIAFRTLLIKMVGIATLLGGIAVLLALVAGKEILTVLYQPEYAQHQNLFVWLMVAAGIGYVSSFLGYGIAAARYFRIQVPLFALVTTSSAIACLWLLPIYGLPGAAFALMISGIVQAVLSVGVLFQILRRLNRQQEEVTL
ncbi:oligosaccharide flippase family protein [Calothrix sp. NIES-2098]|uniref:oligosaccharide flippase family protein n=1 Tax=Calothrix sp. NIES-2098 TaxID=1954171 RepID=UPI000B5E26E3|nr:polysaccharide biosynthesis protein [Calothrix sp. NIES-2098]